MDRKLTPQSSLETLKREAKRWLRALRENDPDARARLARSHPQAPPNATLRDVQLALAREYGCAGWAALKAELASRSRRQPASRDGAIQSLLDAANRGDAERVREVLDAHPGIVNERAELPGHTGKRTALHFAMNSVNDAVVDVLLSHGADPNIRDDGDNAMPLHFAAERRNLEIVKRLIEHGADPIGAGDYHDLAVIGWATCFGDPANFSVADYLLAHGSEHTIFSAVAMGAADAIRRIVGISSGERDRVMDNANRRRRPLHLAVVHRRPASLGALLDLGAELDAEDDSGLTALDQAALIGASDLAQRLIDGGARLRLPAAVALDRPPDVERLLAQEPDALRPGARWGRLIVRAAESSSAAVVATLLEHGASVHARDDARTAVDNTHGYTPLHAAAFAGKTDVVRELLRHGASPSAREDKWWGTPAGWANYAGHAEARDLILTGPIDIFDAITFDRVERLDEILTRDPSSLEHTFGRYVTGEAKAHAWVDVGWTPVMFAVANGKAAAARALRDRGARLDVRDQEGRSLGEVAAARGQSELAAELARDTSRGAKRATTESDLVARFLEKACLDWRTGGSARTRATHEAGRMLAARPGLARANIFTAVVCGDIDAVVVMLDARPELAVALGGPRGWAPLLYLCDARLPAPWPAERAVEIARALLDRGADANAFYLGGNADIHYTALTSVLGRGEELASTHPAAPELARLLFEHGADPYDGQVVYNVFADHASRPKLGDDIVWLLDLMHAFSLRRGRAADWDDPTWPMFAMRGAPSLGDGARVYHGARLMLDAAVSRHLLAFAEWVLAHGAGPDTPWGTNPPARARATVYEEAVARGQSDMARLLARYGAAPVRAAVDGVDALVGASLRMDRASVAALFAAHPEYVREPRPMFAAIDQDRADVVEMLLELGVSPEIESPSGWRARPLHAAAFHGAERCAAVLLAHGAAVDAREESYDGIPLGIASWAQQPRLVALLGAASRDVWELTDTGSVDRLRVVLGEEPGLARVVNESGETPLMWLPNDAADALGAARLLIAHGADAGARDRQGRSAADIAETRALEHVAAFLRSVTGERG
ncbi:MAG TPA: ankyrin repeat domain-containing protein [Gemmatimonadaceae bacterium]|nr:ankyrin repeat domain-containing protein [Gemmatimonadaceae bacterium]